MKKELTLEELYPKELRDQHAKENQIAYLDNIMEAVDEELNKADNHDDFSRLSTEYANLADKQNELKNSFKIIPEHLKDRIEKARALSKKNKAMEAKLENDIQAIEIEIKNLKKSVEGKPNAVFDFAEWSRLESKHNKLFNELRTLRGWVYEPSHSDDCHEFNPGCDLRGIYLGDEVYISEDECWY